MKLNARKMGSMKSVKESLKKGGSNGGSVAYIKNVPADGITVRFLTEPEEWFGYYEWYDAQNKAFVPMVDGEVLPDGVRPSFRYLANALDIDSDRVIPLKLAKTAANVLILKYDKYDTMIDRNYELERHGEGLDTTYDVTPGSQSTMNLAKYTLLDLEAVLIAARAQATGETADAATSTVDDDDDDDEDIVEDTEDSDDEEEDEEDDDSDDDSDEDEDEDEEEEEEEEAPQPKSGKRSARDGSDAPAPKSSAKSAFYDYDTLFPNDEFRYDYTEAELRSMSEDELDEVLEWWDIDGGDDPYKAVLTAQDEYDGEDEEYDEDSLRAMSIRELRLIASDFGIDHKGVSKDDLVDAIINAAED